MGEGVLNIGQIREEYQIITQSSATLYFMIYVYYDVFIIF